MQNSGPYALANGVAQLVADPGAKLGYSSAAIQVQNASPFTLDVSANGQTYSIQEFTAQTIPVVGDATPVSILPTGGPTGTQGELTVVWLLPNEPPPMADGQLTGAAQYAVGLGETLYGPTSTSVNGSGDIILPTIAVPPTVRTLILVIQGIIETASGYGVILTGNVSKFFYYNDVPYLGSVDSNYSTVVVPYNGLVDSSFSLTISGQVGDEYGIEIFGDTAAYEEERFYNGIPLAYELPFDGAFLNGPCRLISADIFVDADTGYLTIGGQKILQTSNGPLSFAGEKGIIVRSGVSITAHGGAVGIVTAYP